LSWTLTPPTKKQLERWIRFDPARLDRLEVIGNGGRRLVFYGRMKDFDLQDQGRTLKVFIDD
jgi:hypothetical protein